MLESLDDAKTSYSCRAKDAATPPVTSDKYGRAKLKRSLECG
jgi:hypothetical protein